MSMITKQIEQLQLYVDIADLSKDDSLKICAKAMREASETISRLSAKLQSHNKKMMFSYLDGVADGMKEVNYGDWIPCSERLPEDGRPVLIYAWSVHHVIARYDEFATENGYKKAQVTADAWNGNTEIKHEVIAWMPLPELPRLED